MNHDRQHLMGSGQRCSLLDPQNPCIPMPDSTNVWSSLRSVAFDGSSFVFFFLKTHTYHILFFLR